MQQILHSKIYGENQGGTPLLVLHGLFGMLDNWGSFGKEFGEKMPVHLLDLRNHGKSFHSDEMSHDAMAADILNYIQSKNIEKAHLLGHSLGGKAVMQFAINHPKKTEKLIVADIAPKSYPPHHQGIIKGLQSVNFDEVKSRSDVDEVLKQYIPEEFVRQFLMKSLYWTDDKKLAWRFNLEILDKKYQDFVANNIKFGVFPGKTLFIRGENSNYILPQDELAIKQQFPDYKIVSIANAAHWLHADKPADFNAAVADFLGS